MRRRDWAGTVVVTALIALAALLHSHLLAAVLLGAVAFAGFLYVVLDVFGSRIRHALSSLAALSPVRIRIERRDRTVPAALPTGERGLWDFRRDAERAMQAMTEILTEMTRDSAKYNKAIERHARRLTKANARGADIECAYALTEKFAEDVERHAASTEEKEARFRVERVRMIENWRAWIAGQPPGTDLAPLVSELRDMGEATAGARTSVEGFRDTVLDLRRQNISQPVNGATDRMVATINRQIENLLEAEQFLLNPMGGLA